MNQQLHDSAEDRLNLAVMDFVRAIRNDERFEDLKRSPSRRKAIIEDHAKAIADAYEVDDRSLIERAGELIAGMPGRSSAAPRM